VTPSTTARKAIVRIPTTLIGGLLILATVAAAREYQSLASTPSTRQTAPSSTASFAAGQPPRGPRLVPGAGDGALPDRTTVFEDDLPGVARLDAALLGALRDAAIDAANDGIEIDVNSGWRSAAYQERLLDEAISRYGSQKEAARWVGTPETSAHVSGDAVDIGPSRAIAWLSRRGAMYGLCQIYRNEPWHFELRSTVIEHGCPPMYSDPTRDPRMRG
jgi:D-alanyl-D-alanine carboxypeptidase